MKGSYIQTLKNLETFNCDNKMNNDRGPIQNRNWQSMSKMQKLLHVGYSPNIIKISEI